MGPKRVRLWISYNDSFAKITLKDGQEVTLREGGPTDEGYCYETSVYQYFREEGKVYSSIERNAKDCDGRLDTFSDYYFDVCNCHTYHEWVGWNEEGEDIYDDEIELVEWQKISSRQRDQFAAMMGY